MGTRDLEIARAVKLRPVEQIAETLGLDPADLEPYGTYKAKVRWKAIERSRVRPDGALVLVTAMTPTPAGEGKSTIAIGLADGLRKLGSRSIVALRQPALGPVFGAKGGATGGGRAQVAPMEEINLHFTGDIHAVGAAHNLLAAMVDKDRKSTRLNSSHITISYAVFCLKKKKKTKITHKYNITN